MQKEELYTAIDFLPIRPTVLGCQRPLSRAQKDLLKEVANFLKKELPVFAVDQKKVWFSRDYIARKMDCSKRQITAKIGILERAGYLIVTECYHRDEIPHKSNIYSLSPIIPLAAELRKAVKVKNQEAVEKLIGEIEEQINQQTTCRTARTNGKLAKVGKARKAALRELIANPNPESQAKVIHLNEFIAAKKVTWRVKKSSPWGCTTRHPGGAQLVTHNIESNIKSNFEFSSLSAKTTEEPMREMRELEEVFERFSKLPNVMALNYTAKKKFIASFKAGRASLDQIHANLDLWERDYIIQQSDDGRKHTIARLFADLAHVSWVKKGIILKNLNKEYNKLSALIFYCQSKNLDVTKFSEWLYEGKGPSKKEIDHETDKINQIEQGETVEPDSNDSSIPCQIGDFPVAKPVLPTALPDSNFKEIKAKIQFLCVQLEVKQKDFGWLNRYRTEIEPEIQTLDDARRMHQRLQNIAKAV